MNRGDLARGILSRLPNFSGRWRVASMIARGSTDGFPALVSEQAMSELMPDGRVVRVRRGLRFRVHRDWIFTAPFFLGDYEPVLSGALMRYVRPGDTVIDIGANFGWYASLLAKGVGPAGRVHAFEPLVDLAGLTEDAIALNGHGRIVRLNQEAVGDRPGTLTIFTFPGLSHGHASASRLGRADAVPHACSVTTLDEYSRAQELGDVSLVKMDVEGHEHAVLRGGEAFLRPETAPAVAFEINPQCLSERGLRAREVEDLLRAYGYTDFWRVDETGPPRLLVGVMQDDHADYLAAKPYRAGRVARAATGRRGR